MNDDKTVVFGVKMRNPDNDNSPTIEAVVLTDDGDKPLMHIDLRMDGEPIIKLFGPDGEVLHQVTGDEKDEEVDGPLNLAWTGDADSGFMDKVKIPMLEIGGRVVAAVMLANAIGVDPQDIFHEMSCDIPGTAIGTSLEEVKEVAAKLNEA